MSTAGRDSLTWGCVESGHSTSDRQPRFSSGTPSPGSAFRSRSCTLKDRLRRPHSGQPLRKGGHAEPCVSCSERTRWSCHPGSPFTALGEVQLAKLFGASIGLFKATAPLCARRHAGCGVTRSGEQWSQGAATESDQGCSPW